MSEEDFIDISMILEEEIDENYEPTIQGIILKILSIIKLLYSIFFFLSPPRN